MNFPGLCSAAFAAGFVDSVVGGGGLVQLPALLLLLPEGTAPATVLGTNKCASIAGTIAATWNYSRQVRMERQVTATAAAAGFVFAAAGAWAVSQLHPAAWRPLVLALLTGVLIYTALRGDFGETHAPLTRSRWAGAALGAALGFYDGFLGPGMGSFLIFAFVGYFGFSFLSASASAKVVNLATNMASVAYFAATRHVLWEVAAPMAACQVAGSLAGSRVAMLRGSAFVRKLFLIVVSAIIARLVYDEWRLSH